MSILNKVFGNQNQRKINEFLPIVNKINSLEDGLKSISNEELKSKTSYFKEKLSKGESLDDILVEAFAVVREVAFRTLSMRHFDVQLIGGIALHKGHVSEMRTGEGKTLVATLPLYLNALTGKGVHLVTVNDYLSRRDAVWMGQIFSFLGLSVGVLNNNASYIYDPDHKELDEKRDEVASYKVVYEFLRPCNRRDAYKADITYGTNSEFGFDYLRDNISMNVSDIRQREFNYAIVDEVDSILIDEARTPLIISAPSEKSEKLYETFAKIAQNLSAPEDFEIDEKRKAVTLTDKGIEKAEKILGVENIYTEGGIKYVHHLETAVRAKALFQRDKSYVVKDNEVIIVDEFTGRMQPGRRWSEGLHQAIEAKEGVSIKEETRTYASITYQNYFRLYKKLAGMTGTAETSKEEFFKVYGLDTIVIPTHRGIKRKDLNDLIFKNEIGKFKAIAKKVKELYQKGQPVLIGTVSIEKNELLSAYLKQEGVPHQILNAKNHEREGEIIAAAGAKKAVTIATNMAGRGVDIKLGGVPYDDQKAEEVKELGGLFVLGTERHEARRVDNQLRGRSGRQGDPGETQFFVSVDDDLMRVFANEMLKKMMDRLNMPDDMPIENRLITRSLETAQNRIEGFHFDSRKHVLEFDDVMNHQRRFIYERRKKILLGSNNDIEQELFSIVGDDKQIQDVIENKKNQFGADTFFNSVRVLMLQTIDLFWMDHLELMDYLRGSVNLRAYGQRDPLIEYKKEGLRLFKEMEFAINDSILKTLVDITPNTKEEKVELVINNTESKSVFSSNKADGNKEVGRNDICPCGSGKKYKKCHGAN